MLIGMAVGSVAALIVAAAAAKTFVAVRRLPLGSPRGLLHTTSVAARWPRARAPKPPSEGIWDSGALGAHLRLAVMHRVRSPLWPLRLATWVIAVPVILMARSALVSRGWDDESAVRTLAYVVAAFNLADADVSPVATLEARSIMSLHAPRGGGRLTVAAASAALIPVLAPLLPLLIALGVASRSAVPVVTTIGALIIATGVLAAGSRRILDATEDTPAPLDLISEMLPTNAPRAVNLAVAQVSLRRWSGWFLSVDAPGDRPPPRRYALTVIWLTTWGRAPLAGMGRGYADPELVRGPGTDG